MDVRGLGSHPLLLMDSSFAVRAAFDAACRVAEFKPNVLFESRTPHTLLALAEAGHGVAIVPSVLPTHRYNLRIVRLTYRRKPLREAYAIVWDKRRSLPPAADDFCQSLVSLRARGLSDLAAIRSQDRSQDRSQPSQTGTAAKRGTTRRARE